MFLHAKRFLSCKTWIKPYKSLGEDHCWPGVSTVSMTTLHCPPSPYGSWWPTNVCPCGFHTAYFPELGQRGSDGRHCGEGESTAAPPETWWRVHDQTLDVSVSANESRLDKCRRFTMFSFTQMDIWSETHGLSLGPQTLLEENCSLISSPQTEESSWMRSHRQTKLPAEEHLCWWRGESPDPGWLQPGSVQLVIIVCEKHISWCWVNEELPLILLIKSTLTTNKSRHAVSNLQTFSPCLHRDTTHGAVWQDDPKPHLWPGAADQTSAAGLRDAVLNMDLY